MLYNDINFRCLPLPREHQLHGRWRRHRSQRLWRMCPHRWLWSDLEDCNAIFTSLKSARSRLLQGRCASVRPVQGLWWNGATSQTLDRVPPDLKKQKGWGPRLVKYQQKHKQASTKLLFHRKWLLATSAQEPVPTRWFSFYLTTHCSPKCVGKY